MKYKIEAYSIYELGARKNQEDSIYPAHGEAGESDRLFILCDGMGGHEAGEVASSAVCEAMSASVLSKPDTEDGTDCFTDEDFQHALSAALASLDEKDSNPESGKKMGTTMTFLKLHDEGVTIAHIGDSRVYHIRPGEEAGDTEILFETSDHSLVNDLVRIGELTPEEAQHSKQKNIITRAMQPHQERMVKADIHHTADIAPGDYFYMCSDGMLEEMGDSNIRFIFSKAGGNDAEKVRELTEVTKDNRDNHSAFIIHILEVEGAGQETGGEMKSSVIPESEIIIPEEPASIQTEKKEMRRCDAGRSLHLKDISLSKRWRGMLWAILAVGLISIGLSLYVLLFRHVGTNIGSSQQTEQPSQSKKFQRNNQNSNKQPETRSDRNEKSVDDFQETVEQNGDN